MAYSTVPTWVTGYVVTASDMATYLRDNMAALWPYTTQGDMVFAGGANSLTRLAKGTDGQSIVMTSGSPAWGNAGGVSKRQGGSATDWNTSGSTNYTPTSSNIQVGTASISLSSSSSGAVTVTFPQAFTNKPIGQVTMKYTGIGAVTQLGISSISSTQMSITVQFSGNQTATFDFYWMAIGQ
jgi:hypothetical protein